MASHFAASAVVQFYISQWKADVDAIMAGEPVTVEIISGQSFKSVPVVAVAGLPAAPATNDEAIITDAANVTYGATPVGGGAQRVNVKYNGTAWKITPGVYTVATLPVTAIATNDEAVVTDATVATNGGTVVGGGSTRVLVRYDGANWKIV